MTERLYFRRSSTIARIKRAAIHGRTAAFPATIHDREDQTGGHPWPHGCISGDHP
ncbi:hypothetical protein [Rhodanobacter geophilus]|uniref:Uncharacterized protein n=1 Tax=Rhodanobacter geophilus TaxID=3162488 RepID=A0ABV3QNK6_9GAMM